MIPATDKEYRITQEFTQIGKVGVALFLGSPVLQAVGYVMYFDSGNPGPAFSMFLGAMGFLCGIVLMLIGRTQLASVVGEVVELKSPVTVPAAPQEPRRDNFPIGRKA